MLEKIQRIAVIKISSNYFAQSFNINLEKCRLVNTTPTPIASSTAALSPDESEAASNPDETTMWSVTSNKNETFSSTESSTEDYGSALNESSTVSNPTTVDISNLNYKQSNYSLHYS